MSDRLTLILGLIGLLLAYLAACVLWMALVIAVLASGIM